MLMQICRAILTAITIEKRGFTNQFFTSNFSTVTLSSFTKFNEQVKRFEKIIISIKPSIPKFGTNNKINAIRSPESMVLYKRVEFCLFNPFKIPSTTDSKYITGTNGAKMLINTPDSRES